MDDLEQQEQECEVLESILGEELFEFKNGKGKIKIEVNIPSEQLFVKSGCSTDNQLTYCFSVAQTLFIY